MRNPLTTTCGAIAAVAGALIVVMPEHAHALQALATGAASLGLYFARDAAPAQAQPDAHDVACPCSVGGAQRTTLGGVGGVHTYMAATYAPDQLPAVRAALDGVHEETDEDPIHRATTVGFAEVPMQYPFVPPNRS